MSSEASKGGLKQWKQCGLFSVFLWITWFYLDIFVSYGNNKKGIISFFHFGVCHVYSLVFRTISLHRFITTKNLFMHKQCKTINLIHFFWVSCLFSTQRFVFVASYLFFIWLNKYPKRKQQLILRVFMLIIRKTQKKGFKSWERKLAFPKIASPKIGNTKGYLTIIRQWDVF